MALPAAFEALDGVHRLVGPTDGVGARLARRFGQVVGRNKAEQLADEDEAFGVVVGEEVRHAGFAVMGAGAAELFLADFFVGLSHPLKGLHVL